ncbi:hypothetical protein D9M71_775750 [compost metagenome]
MLVGGCRRWMSALAIWKGLINAATRVAARRRLLCFFRALVNCFWVSRPCAISTSPSRILLVSCISIAASSCWVVIRPLLTRICPRREFC